MTPSRRGDHGDEESSRARHSRYYHDSRRHRDRDSSSVDSGYGGSSSAPSPSLPQKGIPPEASPGHPGSRGRPNHDADEGNEASWEDSGSDSSDYDPRSKYYLSADEDQHGYISSEDREPSSGQAQPGKGREKTRPAKRDRSAGRAPDRRDPAPRRRRRRADSPAESELSDRDQRSRRRSPSRPRRRALSPVPSEGRQTSPDRRRGSRMRSRSRRYNGRAGRSDALSDAGSTDPQADDLPVRSRTSPERPRRRRGSRDGRARQAAKADSSWKGVTDIDEAWFKTFKERITKGVDMNQVKKVGLDAAAVAAVKVAVGTQVPWKQRIPKTISVGLAAAVTDFLVSKTSFQPKGMVGTMFVRQFIEIALANMLINPVSNKVTGAAQKTKGKGQVGNGKKPSGGNHARPSGGRLAGGRGGGRRS